MTDNSWIADILEDNGMISIEAGMNIYHLLSQVILLQIPGDVVELGCHAGFTSALMEKTLEQFDSDKRLHVYDSFQGLPEKSEDDGDTEFDEGWLKVDKESLFQNFKRFNLKLPEVHVGWFSDTLPIQLPEKISFAQIDCDFYSSIMESLDYLYPRLSDGSIAVIHDYYDPEIHNKIQEKLKIEIKDKLPGVKKACDHFFKNKEEKVRVMISGSNAHGYFRKGDSRSET